MVQPAFYNVFARPKMPLRMASQRNSADQLSVPKLFRVIKLVHIAIVQELLQTVFPALLWVTCLSVLRMLGACAGKRRPCSKHASYHHIDDAAHMYSAHDQWSMHHA